MRTIALLSIASLALALVAFVPTASAVGTCSELKDDYCDDYLVCVGYTWDSRGFQCQRGVRDPFDCTCPPPRDPL